ncbi:hypothetical protein M2277_001788 [Paenibacillus sp. LBL]|nr:hypothetical protein [Paenibacillus sp. LBL]
MCQLKKEKTDHNGPVCTVNLKKPPSYKDEGTNFIKAAKTLYPALLFRHRDGLDPVLGVQLA